MKELFNQTISYIYSDEDHGYLVFIDELRQSWAYAAYGDCCSTSWFESINNMDNLLDEYIIGIEEKPERTAESSGKSPHEDNCIVVYGYTFKTRKGYCDIEFRNESNGYYGGRCNYLPGAEIDFASLEEGKKMSENRTPLILRLPNGLEIKIYPWTDKVEII